MGNHYAELSSAYSEELTLWVPSAETLLGFLHLCRRSRRLALLRIRLGIA